jgi:hypothetical protein
MPSCEATALNRFEPLRTVSSFFSALGDARLERFEKGTEARK